MRKLKGLERVGWQNKSNDPSLLHFESPLIKDPLEAHRFFTRTGLVMQISYREEGHSENEINEHRKGLHEARRHDMRHIVADPELATQGIRFIWRSGSFEVEHVGQRTLEDQVIIATAPEVSNDGDEMSDRDFSNAVMALRDMGYDMRINREETLEKWSQLRAIAQQRVKEARKKINF